MVRNDTGIERDLDKVFLSIGFVRDRNYAGRFGGETDLAHLQAGKIHRLVFWSVHVIPYCNNLC